MENFTFNQNTSSSCVTWSPPSFYSDDIPQESITTYHVYVQNKDGSIIVDVNTTNTSYVLPSNLTECDIYNVSVTAFIEQYNSLVRTVAKEYTGSKIVTFHFNKLLYYQIILSTYSTML